MEPRRCPSPPPSRSRAPPDVVLTVTLTVTKPDPRRSQPSLEAACVFRRYTARKQLSPPSVSSASTTSSRDIMSRIPRRLRSLNIPEQASESVQPDEENLEGPPEIDDLVPKKPPDSTRQIKIIWPNGDVRQIIGEFRGKNLSELRGGKIIVETDENGIPNERSAAILGQHLTWLAENSTFAPLHIPRWDNELFLQKHGQMITDVEVDLNKRVAGSDLPNESNKKAEEHAPLSAMQELHRSNCVRAKECYASLSLPQEKKKAYIEKSDRANQEGAESTLPNEQITNQELHPSFSARTKEYYTVLSLPHMVAKKARIETFDKANQGRAESTKEGYTNQGSAESTLPNKHITAQELHTSFSSTTKEDYTGSSLPHRVAKKAHIEKIDRVNQGCAESTLLDKTDQELHRSDCARTKEGCTSISSPHEHTVAKKAHDGPESKNGHAENINATKQGGPEPSVQLHRITKKGKLKVLLVSLNPRSKNKFVAEGTLVSRDKTYMVGGNMLGEQYVAVSVCAVSRLGDETLVRPHGKLQTVRDAIGHVIAWPLSHVKKPKLTTSAQPRNKPPNTG